LDTTKSNEKNVNKTMRFIILVPHRDALKPYDEYRQRLFAAGLYGAFSFPLSAPLSEVSRPFSHEELKELAQNIRARILRNPAGNADGKITGNGNCQTVKASQLSFFGPSLDLPVDGGLFPGSVEDKLLGIFNPTLLCTALAEKNPDNVETPAISFRAAYVANLAIRQLAIAAYSFEWKMGEPVWLPKAKIA